MVALDDLDNSVKACRACLSLVFHALSASQGSCHSHDSSETHEKSCCDRRRLVRTGK